MLSCPLVVGLRGPQPHGEFGWFSRRRPIRRCGKIDLVEMAPWAGVVAAREGFVSTGVARRGFTGPILATNRQTLEKAQNGNGRLFR
jgi:hypothetical protein